MVCQGCFGRGGPVLCLDCRADLRPAPDRILPGGIPAIAAFAHTGVAARLVHSYKYRGLPLLAELAAFCLRPRLVEGSILVPIPRAWSRLLRYGVDPAASLAHILANDGKLRVERVIARPIHNPRRAGGDHERVPRPFALQKPEDRPIILVDDVLTTGRTMIRAIEAFAPGQVTVVVTATSAYQVSSLSASGGLPLAGEQGSLQWPQF